MQSNTDYDDLVGEIIEYFDRFAERAASYGITDWVLDPGFGFGKTLEQNYEIMNQMERLHVMELPLLVGISRKSMIFKLLGTTPMESLNGTTVLNTISLMKGAHILRVHDVRQAVECVKMVQSLNSQIAK
jgi:dihydropteroate synthase